MTNLRDSISRALARAAQELLAARSPEGHWAGKLSSSALSTATACCALAMVQRATSLSKFDSQISSGLDWLTQHQNADGGWGDTILSLSNLSTTVLVWSAFGAVPGADEKFSAAVTRAARWIEAQAGGLEGSALALAIIRRYGKDRTFSVPILTMCALAGRLGGGRDAWQQVIPLPFELAALPHSWFATLRLPVVSYALPALIAIGQARHHHAPSRNPALRIIRTLARRRTLKALESIQPSNGGFLEATPLTSFVTLSMAGSGQVEHPVCRKAVKFILASQWDDGSWPIDTNLATWLTTLSVNALAGPPGAERLIQPNTQAFEPSAIRTWLFAQQYRQEHPYTHAAPGGWGWTNLPGGVPDADDTAGALLALGKLGPADAETREAVQAGVSWLLGLQNRDGGIPTFCRGWGALPFDRSAADLTAHALRAWTAWEQELSPPLRARVSNAMPRALNFLRNTQTPDGAWLPLWFGNQFASTEENPVYGTSRVVSALAEILPRFSQTQEPGRMLARGVQWLLNAQHPDGSWGGFPNGPLSIEETALALEALAAAAARKPLFPEIAGEALLRGIQAGASWLVGKVESGQWQQPAPIGFYFAKLWYYERLYPLIFTVAALSRVHEVILS